MNNIADQFPFLEAATAPEIFASPSSSSNPSSLIFGPEQSPNLRVAPKLKPKLRIKKSEYGGSGAVKVARECSECGKKFWSWKALFGHMRCHPERQWRGMNPPTNFLRPVGSLPLHPHLPNLWLTLTEEDYEVVECLMMLANSAPANRTEPAPDNVEETGRFECSSCKKVFGSHQALGGHRASHKNVKGCFALMSSSSNTDLREDPRLVFDQGKDIVSAGTNLNLDLRLGL